MREGFYRIEYEGETGLGFAVLALETNMVVGADAGGGTYDGKYVWNAGSQLLDMKVSVWVPEGAWVVQGQIAPAGGLRFDVECSFPRIPDNQTIVAKTDLGPVAVQFQLIREFPP